MKTRTEDDIRNDLSIGQYLHTDHSFEEMINDNISDSEIRECGDTAEIIEDYPQDFISPSCLVLAYTKSQNPIHFVVSRTTPIMKIITMYRPNPELWIDFKYRR